MPGVKITDLPVDNSLVASGDSFIKVKNGTTYKVTGDTFVRQFSGITDAANLGSGIPVFDSLTPNKTKANFNSLSAGYGINIIQTNNTIGFALSGDNIITSDMIQPGSITAELCDPDLIDGTTIAQGCIGYSQLQGGDTSEALKDRVSDCWVNFNGARITAGTGYAPVVTLCTFSSVAPAAGTTTVTITFAAHGLATGNSIDLSATTFTAGSSVTIPGAKKGTTVVWDNALSLLNGNYKITKINANSFRVQTTRRIYGTINGTVKVTKASGNQANGITGDQISMTAGSATGQWKASTGNITWASTDVGVIFYITAPSIGFKDVPVRITGVTTSTNTAQFTFTDGLVDESKVITGNAYTFNSFGIRSSYNVDGITKVAVGQWKVSFRKNRTDNFYATVGSCNDPTATSDAAILSVNAQATTDVTISTTRVSPPAKNAVTSGYVDSTNVSLVVFGL
jgi:hypothetical protein